jgi:type IV pilus assembly protein PilY1
VDPLLEFNTLVIGSNIPSSDVCTSGGSSYTYELDIGTGSARSSFGTTAGGAAIAGRWEGGAITVGFTLITLQSPGGAAGSGSTMVIPINNSGGFGTPAVIPPGPAPASAGRRTSWRELVN